MAGRLIIVNRMYAGDYFNQGENIGGEVINLLRSDEGDNYIWINPHGTCKTEYLDFYDEIFVLLVKKYAPWKWQVIGLSKVDIESSKTIAKDKHNATTHKYQREKIAKKVKYGKKQYSEITKDNILNGEKTYDTALFFTFKSEKIWVPEIKNSEDLEKTIFCVSNENENVKNDQADFKSKYKKGLTPRPLYMYIHNKDGLTKYREKEKDFDKNKEEYIETFNYLNKIIESCCGEENKDFPIKWKELPEDETVNKYKDFPTNVFDEYFLDIIGDADHELSFSNLLAYFLRNKKILKSFVKEFLKIEGFDFENASIQREESNIDLLISSKTHQIIIENKIKSYLIFKDKGIKTKLDDYFSNSGIQKDAKSELNKKFFSENNELKHSQIDRYFAYAISKAIDFGVKTYDEAYDKVKGFVIVPNYNYTIIEKEIDEAIFKEKFDVIKYDELYHFFEKFKGENIKYLDEFLKAMYKHTKNIDNSIEEKTQYYFYKKIKEI